MSSAITLIQEQRRREQQEADRQARVDSLRRNDVAEAEAEGIVARVYASGMHPVAAVGHLALVQFLTRDNRAEQSLLKFIDTLPHTPLADMEAALQAAGMHDVPEGILDTVAAVALVGRQQATMAHGGEDEATQA